MSFSVFLYASLAPKEDSYRFKCRTAFTLYRYKRSSRMSVSLWNENPNKLIQKWLVSNKFYSGIMWQPIWTRSWTKLIPISCERPLKDFIPRASHFALLSECYKFQQRWSNNALLTASLPLNQQRLVTTKSTYSNFSNSTQTKIFIQGKYSFLSVSIIAWLARDMNRGGENTTQNLSSCQKVISRRNIIIETANKIKNKQGKSVMSDLFTNCSDLCQ